jgi:small-conductance mechanosensitive channel
MLLSSVIYCIVLLILTILYFYVYALVFRFFTRSPSLRSKNEVIRKISLRFLLNAFTFIMLLVFGFLTITRFFAFPVGQSIVHFGFIVWLNLGSTLTISAFLYRTNNSGKSATAGTNSASGNSGSASAAPAPQSGVSWKGRNTVGNDDDEEESSDESESDESSEEDSESASAQENAQ